MSKDLRMYAFRLVCLLATLFFFAEQTDGQAAKTPAEWNMQLATEYPNPIQNDTRCNISPPMRICDPNHILNATNRNEINEKLKEIGDKKNLQNADCSQSGIVVVAAIMKSIGPGVNNAVLEADDLAKKYRSLWSLDNCSVVLTVANDSKIFVLDLGEVLRQKLPSLNTTSVKTRNSSCFNENHFGGDVATAIQCLTVAFDEEIQRMIDSDRITTSKPENGNPDYKKPRPSESRTWINFPNICMILVAFAMGLIF